MKLGVQVGLCPSHIVLDGEPAPPPLKRHSPHFSAHICCGQMAGWVKMPLGMEADLSPGNFVLDGDPSSNDKRGHILNFRPILLWPNSRMDQDGTWHPGRPRSRPHCARWGPSSLPQKGDRTPNFRSILLWPNGWMHQDATWYGGRLRPRPHCARWGPSSPQKGWGHNPQFSAHVYCGQTAEWIKMPLDTEVGLCPSDIVLDGNPAPPAQKRKGTSPQFSAHVFCGQTAVCIRCCMYQDTTWYGARRRPKQHCVRWKPI